MPYDIHIEGVAAADVTGIRFLTFGNSGDPVAVRGIQKMVDRYLKCILTPRGSDISDKDYGTDLMNAFASSIDASTVYQLAVMAATDAESTIKKYDTERAAPADERLAAASVENVTVNVERDGFDMTILLRNSAGTTVLASVNAP